MTALTIAQQVNGFIFDGTDSILSAAQAFEAPYETTYYEDMELIVGGAGVPNTFGIIDQNNVWQVLNIGDAIYARIESNAFCGWRMVIPNITDEYTCIDSPFRDTNDFATA